MLGLRPLRRAACAAGLFLLAAALSVLTTTPALAQDPGPGPTDPAELEHWLDGTMEAHLAAYHSVGAVVSVVKDGELFFSKGYGYSDLEGREKVDPAKTLFRIGSVSKLFIWTSVMQLVEDGKLDLHEDVNTYLTDIRVPKKFGMPITLANLMSHTPGFEDQIVGLFSHDPDSIQPLSVVLKRELPKRVRRPGLYASYSNHGTGLAMHIVEEVSGMPWGQYIQQNILDPLDMTQITFDQPVPEALAGDLSKGYRFQNNVFKEQEFEFVPLGPIGCASACADEMAKFMIAHLQLGRYGDNAILEEDTATLMQSELHRMAPGVNPMAHGFIDMSQNGQRVIGHGGATLWFHTMLALLPEHNVGIFVSHNTNTGGNGAADVVKQFIDRYNPEEDPPPITPPPHFDNRAEKFLGSYRPNRHSYKSIAKLGAAMGTVRITSSGDGALLLSASGEKRWIETEALTFREEFGNAQIVFIENDEGAITHFLSADNPTSAFDKDGPLDGPKLHLTILLASIGLFLLTIFMWPLTAILRWRHDVLLSSQDEFPFLARLVTWLSSLIFLGFLVALANAMQDPNNIVYGISPDLEMLLYLPMIAAVFVLASIFYTYHVWRNRQGRIHSRAYYTLLTLTSIAFLCQLFYWNLLGHRY